MSVTISGSGQIVKQVVNSTTFRSTATAPATTSASFVTTNESVTITPTSSSNKVLVTVTSDSYMTAAGTSSYTIYRNGTNLASGTATSALTQHYNAGGAAIFPLSMSFLDSPATTSACTYTVYFATSGTLYFGYPGNSYGSMGIVITAQEISGT